MSEKVSNRKIIYVSIAEDVVACAPQARLQQVLINLVENAIKYFAPEQLVELVLENREPQVMIHVGDRPIGISLPIKTGFLSDFTGWMSQGRTLETVQGWDWRSPKGLIEGLEGRITLGYKPGEGIAVLR